MADETGMDSVRQSLGKGVDLVVYHHKNGTDAWLAELDEGFTTCAAVMLEWQDKVDEETRHRVLAMIAHGNFSLAAEVWAEESQEYFEVTEIHELTKADDAGIRAQAKELLDAMPPLTPPPPEPVLPRDALGQIHTILENKEHNTEVIKEILGVLKAAGFAVKEPS